MEPKMEPVKKKPQEACGAFLSDDDEADSLPGFASGVRDEVEVEDEDADAVEERLPLPAAAAASRSRGSKQQKKKLEKLEQEDTDEVARPTPEDVHSIISTLDAQLNGMESDVAQRVKACKALRQRLSRLGTSSGAPSGRALQAISDLDNLYEDLAVLSVHSSD